MTPKEDRFCQEYPVDLNGAQAAIRAGYSARSARQVARRLLTKDYIQARIAEIQTERSQRVDITAERVLKEFSFIAFSDLTQLFEETKGKFLVKDLTSLPENVRKAIASISPVQTKDGILYKITLYDKTKALDSLSKYLGMLSDFNGAIATLKTYGIHLQQTDEGWSVKEEK